VDLTDSIDVQISFEELKHQLKSIEELNMSDTSLNHFRIIVAGGDGTVGWVIQEMIKHQITIDLVPIGVIPFGTGNDFSRVLGWGGTQPDCLDDPEYLTIKNLMQEWVLADVCSLDLWEVVISVDQKHGRIAQVSDKKTTLLTELNFAQQPCRVLQVSKWMVNYFGIGVSARVVFNFEKSFAC